MAEQEPMTDAPRRRARVLGIDVDPAQHGLWKRYVEAGRINHAAWLRAVAENGFVGTCRRCGSYLRPQPAHDHGNGRLDYTADCVNAVVSENWPDGARTVQGCGGVVCAPGGRLPGTAEREAAAAKAAAREARKAERGPRRP